MNHRKGTLLVSNSHGGGQIIRLMIYFTLLVALSLLQITWHAG